MLPIELQVAKFGRHVILGIVILGLIAFLMGLFMGKQIGHTQGYERGLKESPLALREQSLIDGYCSLCHENINETSLAIKKEQVK